MDIHVLQSLFLVSVSLALCGCVLLTLFFSSCLVLSFQFSKRHCVIIYSNVVIIIVVIVVVVVIVLKNHTALLLRDSLLFDVLLQILFVVKQFLPFAE